jgi:hypothetical protein
MLIVWLGLVAWVGLDALFLGGMVFVTQRRERRIRLVAGDLATAAERYANGLPGPALPTTRRRLAAGLYQRRLG